MAFAYLKRDVHKCVGYFTFSEIKLSEINTIQNGAGGGLGHSDDTKQTLYLLLLSVSVIPWEDTLKWTTVAAGRGFRARVHLVALETASGPVSDSVSTEFR